MDRLVLYVDGTTIGGIYSGQLARLLQSIGSVSTRRVSHVDAFHDLSPSAQQLLTTEGRIGAVNDFYADMSPVFGPVLGPFPDREAALAAETAWLHDNSRVLLADS